MRRAHAWSRIVDVVNAADAPNMGKMPFCTAADHSTSRPVCQIQRRGTIDRDEQLSRWTWDQQFQGGQRPHLLVNVGDETEWSGLTKHGANVVCGKPSNTAPPNCMSASMARNVSMFSPMVSWAKGHVGLVYWLSVEPIENIV